MAIFESWSQQKIEEFRYRAKICQMPLTDEEIEHEMNRLYKPYKPAFISEWDILRRYEEMYIEELKLTLEWYENGCPITNEKGFMDMPENYENSLLLWSEYIDK